MFESFQAVLLLKSRVSSHADILVVMSNGVHSNLALIAGVLNVAFTVEPISTWGSFDDDLVFVDTVGTFSRSTGEKAQSPLVHGAVDEL